MAELNKNYSYEKTRQDYYYYYALPILQFTNYIQHIHHLSNNYGSVYATAFANYSSPYKTNMTRVHFKLRTNRPIFTHEGNSPQNRNRGR